MATKILRRVDKKGRIVVGIALVNQVFEIEPRGDGFFMRRVRPRKTLAQMLATVTPGEVHREEPLGPPVGLEVW